MRYELLPKVIFGIIGDIAVGFFTGFLWLIPFLDGDRQVVPNKHPALIYKHPPVLLWSNRFTIIIYFFDGEPLITIQLFVRPSFRSSCRLLRSGGLKEEERVINIYLDQLMNRGNTRLYIYMYLAGSCRGAIIIVVICLPFVHLVFPLVH